MLDTFSGEGGTVAGYQRAGFHVTAVELDPARAARNPADVVIVGDALEYIDRHGSEYDAVHASPTCTGYSRGTAALPYRLSRYLRLIPAVRDLLTATGRPYVIENVEDARSELVNPLRLCGKEFGLGAYDDDEQWLTVKRHRLFESNVALMSAGGCPGHPRSEQVGGCYGGARRDKTEARTIRHGGYVPANLTVLRTMIGADWMSERGCFLSVPPDYAQFIGYQLLDALRTA